MLGWQFVNHKYLMRNVSILKMDVIFVFSVSLLVIAQNFVFLPALDVPDWQPCHQSWIIDEERVNFKIGCHIRTCRVNSSHCIIFHLTKNSGSAWLAICHHSCIVNDEPFNSKNGSRIRTCPDNSSHFIKFYPRAYSGKA